jgi:hypothetical protein
MATGMFPNTAAEMDAFLGFEGERIADRSFTPGRNKVVWHPTANIKLTFEEHPYDLSSMASHRLPHWHLDTPTGYHIRYLPGDAIPNW